MTSSFLRSTRNLSSVHSGSGSGWGPLRSSSDPGRGESVLRSLLEPWSDCCKYPLKASHWAAIALRSNFSSGHCVLFKVKLSRSRFAGLALTFNSVTSRCCAGSSQRSFFKPLRSPPLGTTSKNRSTHWTARYRLSAELTERRAAHSKHTNQLLGKVSRVILRKKKEEKKKTRDSSQKHFFERVYLPLRSCEVSHLLFVRTSFDSICVCVKQLLCLVYWKPMRDYSQLQQTKSVIMSWKFNLMPLDMKMKSLWTIKHKGRPDLSIFMPLFSVRLAVNNNTPCDQFIGL